MRATAIRTMLGFLVAMSIATGLLVAGPVDSARAAEPDDIYSLVNRDRAASGLQPLFRNAALDTVALNWASRMGATSEFMHNPSFSSQIPAGWTRAGENVAYGWADGEITHAQWMASAGHRANILGDFTDIGIAFIVANGRTWSVEVFAAYPGRIASAPGAGQFVSAMYNDVLGRAPGASEAAGWVQTLALGYTPVQVASGFVNSDEYRLRRIGAAYSSILNRGADPSGVTTWLTEMRAGRIGPDDVEKTFLASHEFFLRAGGTDEQFVAALYRRLLLREASSGEIAEWAGIIRAHDRFAVVDSFWRCLETAQQRVTMMYRDYLGRTPDAQGLTSWAWIAIGQGDGAVRWSIVGSAEYWARAGSRF